MSDDSKKQMLAERMATGMSFGIGTGLAIGTGIGVAMDNLALVSVLVWRSGRSLALHLARP